MALQRQHQTIVVGIIIIIFGKWLLHTPR